MTAGEYVDYLLRWLEELRQTLYKKDAYVLGISGGIDSAVCAHLLQKTGREVFAYTLPAEVSSSSDISDARQVFRDCGFQYREISIAPMFEMLMQEIKPELPAKFEREQVLYGNLMARLRMVSLFTLAQAREAVVVGTDNLAEYHTGYFTKFGDGAADCFPLAKLRKEQVRELAKYLGVNNKIIEKAPSAGLCQGQTDEDEMGVSYQEIDAFLRGENVSDSAKERIDFWHNRSVHKRMLPPVPEKAWE